jgi:hypothetical protein
MNIYTVEEREAQAALELVKALEAKHRGLSAIGVSINEDAAADVSDGKRHVIARIAVPNMDVVTVRHAYAPEDADDLVTDIEALFYEAAAPKTDTPKAQAAERLGANLDTLRAAVADGDLTRADVEAETKAVQQPKAPARKRKPAPKKATPKGKA